MAAETNYTFRTEATGTNNPPQVDDNLYIISPNDTPLLALLDSESVADVVHYNMVEDIPNPTAAEAGLGETGLGTPVTGTLPRIMQQTKRLARNFEVSLTAMTAEKYALTSDQYQYKAQLAFLKLAKQFETELIWSAYAAYSSGAAARSFAGFIEWLITTGEARASGDSTCNVAGNSVLPSGYFSGWYDCYANSTVMTEDVMNGQLQNAYQRGTDISSTIAVCGGTVKRRISNFSLVYNEGATSAARNVSLTRTMQEMNRRSVSMDYYESDFGPFGVVLHRQMNSAITSTFAVASGTTGTTGDNFKAAGDDTIFWFDPAFFSIATFRPFQTHDLAPTDDSRKGYVTADLGLWVKNPKAAFGISRVDNTL